MSFYRLTPAEIEALRDGIEKEHSVRCLYNGADMSKPAEIAAMVKDAETRLGGVDILVNNAGIQFVSPIEDFPIEKWDAIIAINLSSAFHGIRAAVPGMKKRGWGRIINTASAHSLVASPFKSMLDCPYPGRNAVVPFASATVSTGALYSFSSCSRLRTAQIGPSPFRVPSWHGNAQRAARRGEIFRGGTRPSGVRRGRGVCPGPPRDRAGGGVP